MRIRALYVAAWLVLAARALAGEPVQVFAAASLNESFREIGKLFAARHGEAPSFSFGATNELRMQIEHGARADVFASASQEEMEKAVQSGVARAPVVFVKNRLVIIVPRSNPGRIKVLRDLARPGLKLVTTHPNVPVGKYTQTMLEKMAADPAYGAAYRDAVKANFRSLEINVKAVCVKVSLGEADAGIVYYSDFTDKLSRTVQALDVPAKYNVEASYPAGVVPRAAHAAAAAKFVEFLISPESQAVFRRFNFGTVGK